MTCHNIIHELPKTQKEIGAKRAMVCNQRRELMGQPVVMITCICGFKLPLKMAFHCWFCGITFCPKCAEEHFGKKPLMAVSYLNGIEDEGVEK